MKALFSKEQFAALMHRIKMLPVPDDNFTYSLHPTVSNLTFLLYPALVLNEMMQEEMKMKKGIALILVAMLSLCSVCTLALNANDEITVLSREDGSGTRGAFVELLGILAENEAGEKVDMTTEEAIITNSTSVMLTGVSGDETAIGYVSLGSMNDTVKALHVDGAAPTIEAIKAGEYKVSRPFNIATGAELSETAQDFIAYILSAEGQAIVESNGYITSVEAPVAYAGKASGKIVVAGSSSVTPLMEKLKEVYLAVNADAEIEIQQSDSTTGMQAAIEGIADIGMASRELKDSEIEKGLSATVIAIDGIAVIVNNGNPLEGLSGETIQRIFKGELITWADAGVE